MCRVTSWLHDDSLINMEYMVHYKGKAVLSVKKAWHSACLAAGITRRIRPYDLRHAFATEAIAADVDVGTVASLMGHSSPTMLLKHYQHVMDRQKREAVNRLPDIPPYDQKRMTKN